MVTEVNAIATAAAEQSAALNGVSAAVGEMDQITQRNAAMVEETTAAIHDLAGDARRLSGLVQGFKLNRRKEIREPDAKVWSQQSRRHAA